MRPSTRDNDVELFIAGPDAYWELELNALGTVYDVLWLWEDVYGPGGAAAPWPELAPSSPARRETLRIDGIAGHVHPRGWRIGFIGWDLPGLATAVHLDGTLNDPSDLDQGWTVEIAVPWASLSHLVPGGTLPPGPGSPPLRLDCSRFEHFTAGGEKLSRPAGWALRRHGAYDSHMPGTFPTLRLVP